MTYDECWMPDGSYDFEADAQIRGELAVGDDWETWALDANDKLAAAGLAPKVWPKHAARMEGNLRRDGWDYMMFYDAWESGEQAADVVARIVVDQAPCTALGG